MSQSTLIKQMRSQWITTENFQPCGQVIFANNDGKPFDHEDAQLHLENGVPRFYIMQLSRRGRKFSRITRHLQCTQCLGSLEGREWLIAVAPPSGTAQPALTDISAFRIPGNCFIKLNLGTWHAGPYFEQDFVNFYNLELSDTNVTDHDTYDLLERDGVEFEIV